MSDAFCVHCIQPIRLMNMGLGPQWRHVDSTLSGYLACRTTTATPPADTEGSD